MKPQNGSTVERGDAAPVARPGRHRTDMVSLLFGAIFLGVALWWALGWTFNWTLGVTLPRFGWFLAAGLILLGVTGLVRSLRTGHREAARSDPEDLP